MKSRLLFILIGFSLLFTSCCFWVKEEHLGNNIYLSEYDNVDRRILFSKEKCSSSGIEIVPMTVLEYAYNSNWIIAKSGSRNKKDFQYWILKNFYKYKKQDRKAQDRRTPITYERQWNTNDWQKAHGHS